MVLGALQQPVSANSSLEIVIVIGSQTLILIGDVNHLGYEQIEL